ncbi:MAG: glycosyltransferase [Bacteroidota bacterium]
MVDILFFPDLEEGHVFPSFKLAHNLSNHGYKVAFMGIADIMEVVSREGFEAHTIFAEYYPKGYLDQLKKVDTQAKENRKQENHRSAMLDGTLDGLLQRLAPKVIISSCFIALEALIIDYKYAIDQFIYSPILPAGPESDDDLPNKLTQITVGRCMKSLIEADVDFAGDLLDFLDDLGFSYHSFEEVVKPIFKMPHLVICPKELMIAPREEDPLEIYLGPGIRPNAQQEDQILKKYLPENTDQKIIYASMGSQTAHYPIRSKKFFDSIIQSMRHEEMKGFHLILSISPFFDRKDFTELPDNVAIHNWVPQVDLLPHVDLVFIHGGLGTIKECICNGLPMIVVPMGRDQFTNARRIDHHQLGLSLKVETLTPEKINKAITSIQDDNKFSDNILTMKNVFLKREAAYLGVKAIEQQIGRTAQKIVHE